MSYADQIDRTRVPRHVAIIMDGNGRWAKEHGKERSEGHRAGIVPVRSVTEAAARIGVEYLTLYTFSTENWNRPTPEIEALMTLLVSAIESETPTLQKNDIRLQAIGDLSRMPGPVRERLDRCIQETARNSRLTLVLALSYSARWELLQAARTLAQETVRGTLLPENIDEKMFSSRLATAGIPDPDLLIRTGGELRISNFLLWQLAYAELYFTETFWPDFDAEAFYRALVDYQLRERRFGKTSEQIKNKNELH